MTNKYRKSTIIAILSLTIAYPTISLSQDTFDEATVSEQVSDENSMDIHNGFTGANLSRQIELEWQQFTSSTSSYYFKAGVKKYKKEQWDEAEKAFEAVLRSDHLHKQALFYLAHINAKQGEEDQVLKYIKAYHGL